MKSVFQNELVATTTDKKIRLTPNPFEEKLLLTKGMSGDNVYSVQIFTIFGKKVLEVPYPKEADVELDLSALHSGMYILNIYNEENKLLESHKLVKK